MSDNNQADKRLVCTNCKLPLTPESSQRKGGNTIRCPRCNTLLTLDSMCQTSCLSCAKIHQKDPSPCVSEIVSIDITNNSQEKCCEISGSNVEGNEHGTLEDKELSLFMKLWSKLKRTLFHLG